LNVVFAYRAFESLGQELLSAVLRRHGHATRLAFDPGLFEDAFLAWKPAARLFRFRDELLSILTAPEVDLICFSPVTVDVAWALALADAVKTRRKDVRVAMGGPHATTMPETLMARPSVDYVVAGEGDTAILDLAKIIDTGETAPRHRPGLYFRENGRVTGTPPRIPAQDLDDLPFADRGLFRQAFPGLAGVHMVTSRYCPNRCAYCQNNALRRVYGNATPVRRYTPGRVIEELAQAKQDFFAPSVRFFDELFSADPAWLAEFVGPYRERIGLPFHCAVSPATVTEETADLLARAGCYEVQMGVQTLREDISRDVLQRPQTRAQVETAVRLLGERGVRVGVDLILGLPGVNEQDLEDTARFFTRHRASKINVYWLQPVPGTDMTDTLHARGWLTDTQRERIEQGEDASGYFLGGAVHRVQKRLLPYEWLLGSAVRRSPTAMERAIRRGWFRRIPSWVPPQLLWMLGSVRNKHPVDTMAIRTQNRYLTFLRRKALGLGLHKTSWNAPEGRPKSP